MYPGRGALGKPKSFCLKNLDDLFCFSAGEFLPSMRHSTFV
jgi:hypothetical protein